MELEKRIEYARGAGTADLVLTNGLIVDVLSGRVHPGSVAIKDGVIVGLDGGYDGKETIDLERKYVAPGLIDCHVHLESSMVAVAEYARTVMPHGTTGVIVDCHEIANVMGIPGIRYMLESGAEALLDVFFMLPSCVPASPYGTSGAALGADELKVLMGEPGVLGLGEMMNFPGTINADPGVMAKLRLFRDKLIDGHAPGLTGNDLTAYITAGPDSDHECTEASEAEEKLRKGMYIFMREGTAARNLKDLLPVMNASNSSRCCMCTDDRSPGDLLERGHIDSMLKIATAQGVSPLTAIQMATINPARRFRLWDRGALGAGYRADMVVFEDFEKLDVAMVFKDGVKVSEKGEMTTSPGGEPSVPPSTFNVKDFGVERLRITADGKRVRVIGVVPGQIVTDSLVAEAKIEEGLVVSDIDRDILKMAVVERHAGTGNIGLGLVRGLGLTRGALASSVAHDCHNIVVVGVDDREMAAAVEHLVKMDGGQVVVEGGGPKESLALPVAGLVSLLSASDVAGKIKKLNSAAVDLGCRIAAPFMAMSFLALEVIPKLKLTDVGLVDVEKFSVVPLFEG